MMGGFLFSLLMMFSVASFATSSPYTSEMNTRFNAIEDLYDSPSTDGLQFKRVARATFDCTAGCAAGAYDLAVNLPANALVTQVYFQIITQFVDAGSGTVALSCEDAGNLYAAADVTGLAVGATTTGIAIGTAGTMIDGIAATCPITATVATATQSAGVMNIFVEYVVID